MNGQRKAAVVIAAIVALWAIGLAVWAVRPLSDSVPVGINFNLEAPREISQDVSCNSLFASTARPDEPLPPLEAQPEAAQPLSYQRTPCVLVQDHARVLFAINVVAIAVAVGAGAFLVRRRKAERDESALATA